MTSICIIWKAWISEKIFGDEEIRKHAVEDESTERKRSELKEKIGQLKACQKEIEKMKNEN